MCVDEEGVDERAREEIEKAARHLFGLIHARFLITNRGLYKMVNIKNSLHTSLLMCARIAR